MNYILEYHNKIKSGEIVACKRIKQVYEKLVDDLNIPKGNWIFDEEFANKPIEFIETFCKQAQGNLGQSFKLQLFQKAKLQAVFGFIDKDTKIRRYKEVLTIEGRKNGKTTELAGVNLYMLVGDGEGAAENYCIATKYEQAKKCFDEIVKMVKQSPLLSKYIRKRKSDLYFEPTMSIIQALASNSNGLDGLNSHMVTIDELAAIKNRDIYDLMKQSMSARRQPLLFCITTNGFVRESIFDSQYEYACGLLDGTKKDDTFLPFIYELDDKEEWDKEECWIKANPGLGTIKNLEDLRSFVNKAKQDDAFKATVMVKDFNMKENASSSWLKFDDLNNEEKFNILKMNFSYGIGGFDMSETTDLSAAKVLCMKPNDDKIYTIQMYWLPEERLNNRTKEDKIPYDLWQKQGILRTCEGNKVNPYDMLEWFVELKEKYNIYIPWIGYDPWHVDSSLLQAYKNEFGEDAMKKVRQGIYTLSAPMKELKADLQAKKILYNNNPIDKWCLSNTEIKTDINGNIQPIKGRDKRKRIDGTMALLDAYIVLKDNMADYKNMI